MRLTPSIVLLRTQSDERLTALAREGSEPAFTALVERYRRVVLCACMRVLPEARAEDATQQAFVSAWKALTRGDDVRDMRPWLLRIARNTALNALRTPGYEYDELAESLQGGSAPPAELERRDVMRQTLAGLAALPEKQREALLRSAVEGAPHAAIARDLGISEGATRQLVLRARAAMRSAVTAITPMPLLGWAASGSSTGVAEVAAGGGTAGAAALLAKAGAVVVLAGGAAATPAIVSRHDPATAKAATRAPREHRPTAQRSRPQPVRDVRPATRAQEAVAAPPAAAPVRARPAPLSRRARRRPALAAAPVSAPVVTSTPQPSTSSGPGPSGGGEDHSGPGGGDDEVATAAPTAAPTAAVTVVPTVNPDSGRGSTSSGSGSSGSGTSGSGSSTSESGSGHGGGDPGDD